MDSLDSSCVSSTSIVRQTVYEKLSSLGVLLPDENKLGLNCRLESSSSCTTLPSTPKPKRRRMTLTSIDKECCFGSSLTDSIHLTTVELDSRTTACVPGALVSMVSFLEDHLETEGLFRKTGSLPRQKAIRAKLCKGEGLSADTSAHDVANLLKVYFRELPVCLFMNSLLDSFISVARDFQETPIMMKKLLLDLCLLLPVAHQYVLQYTLQFFFKLSEYASSNLMDLDNISVVLTPNLMPSPDVSCPDLDLRTKVVKILVARSRWLARRRYELMRGSICRLQSLTSLQSEDSVHPVLGRKKLKRRASIKDLGQFALRKGKAIAAAADNPLKRRATFRDRKASLIPDILKGKKQARLSKLLHPDRDSKLAKTQSSET